MNRVVADRLMVAGESGQMVVCITRRSEMRAYLHWLADLPSRPRVWYAHSCEGVEFSNGGRVVFVASEGALRGHDADLVVVDGEHDEFLASAWVAVNALGGEVVQA